MPDKTAPAELLAAAIGPIEKWCDGWYLFGAQAVVLWGRPRLTANVDITIRLRLAEQSEAISGFRHDMEIAGFRLRFSDPGFVARTRVLRFLHISTRLSMSSSPVLAWKTLSSPDPSMSISRACPCRGVAGGLIVMKILAGRPKDREDLRTTLTERRANLDIHYIRSLVEALEQALGQSDLSPVLEAELKRLRL